MLNSTKLKDDSLFLSELVKKLKVEEIINFKDYQIKYITNNSKKVVHDSIFVAIQGFKTDGHQYILEAIDQGAKAIVGEKEIKLPIDIPYIKVKNSRKALAKLATKFYSYPSQYMRLIGITGTTGKTTTNFMVDRIINQVVKRTGLIGTLYTKIGAETYSNPQSCTTPNAVALNKRLALMKERDINYVSMEVSSHALKLDRVSDLDFDISIFTNLSYDHLDFHQDIDDYFFSKTKLFTNLKKDGIAILNQDDSCINSLTNSIQGRYYTYSIKNNADVMAQGINLTKEGLEFEIIINTEMKALTGKVIAPQRVSLQLPILGYHNVYNALAAFTAGLMLGFRVDNIKSGLEKFNGVKRRMELIYDQEFTIIDDFAHNPASLTASFETISKLDYNDLVVVHFLKGSRGTIANKLNAQLIANYKEKLNLKQIITTRCAETVIAKNKVLPEEEEMFTKIMFNNEIPVINFPSLFSALKAGLDNIESGDLLLILGGPGLNKAHKIIDNLLLD